MKRLPLLSTLIVALAVAAMIGLGIWQLHRADWKAGLLTRYQENMSLPEVAFPAVPVPDDALLFRHAHGYCLQAIDWTARAGRDRTGRSGWRHIAHCRTGAEGPGMAVDFGWSERSNPPVGYSGGPVSGILARDTAHVYLLVAEKAAPGLEPSALPSPADLPNNHLSYAVQWFLFAGVAVLIYLLALRQRLKLARKGPDR